MRNSNQDLILLLSYSPAVSECPPWRRSGQQHEGPAFMERLESIGGRPVVNMVIKIYIYVISSRDKSHISQWEWGLQIDQVRMIIRSGGPDWGGSFGQRPKPLRNRSSDGPQRSVQGRGI